MKIACIGLTPGRLSSALMSMGVEFISSDITKRKSLRKDIEKVNPDVIIHTAAATRVDWCEENPQKAMAINVRGVDNIVSWWKGRLIYISTDYVFNGNHWFSQGYSENHKTDPVSIYGMTKLAGEMIASSGWPKCTIVRTTVLYGGNPPDFVSWILSQYDKGEPFYISSKMITTPTNIYHLAEALLYIIDKDIQNPIINIAGGNIVSRYMFARMIGISFNKDVDLLKSDGSTTFGIAKRPTRAGLRTDLARSLGIPIYPVNIGLELMKDMKGA